MGNLIKLENVPVTKGGIEELVKVIEMNIALGDVEALNAYVAIKAMGELVKQLEKNEAIKKAVLEDLNNGVICDEAKIIKKTATTYDYTCSLTWCELDSKIAELTEKRKVIETALKNASELTPFNDPTNSKVITECPKESEKVTIAVTLNK